MHTLNHYAVFFALTAQVQIECLLNWGNANHLFETYLMLREKLKQAQEVIAKLQKP